MITQDMKERKSELLSEQLAKNRAAAKGRLLIRILLGIVFFPRILFTIWEIIFFIIEKKPLNILGAAFLIPLIFIIWGIYRGNKKLIYILIAFPIIRLILYFTLLNPIISEGKLGDIYPFTLFSVLILQFISSLVMLKNYHCDVYFTAKKRVNLKYASELKKKTKNKS